MVPAATLEAENPCDACVGSAERLCTYTRGVFSQVVGMHEVQQAGETLERCAAVLVERAGCTKTFEDIYTELGRMITESTA